MSGYLESRWFLLFGSFDCIGLQVGLFYMALLVYILIADGSLLYDSFVIYMSFNRSLLHGSFGVYLDSRWSLLYGSFVNYMSISRSLLDGSLGGYVNSRWFLLFGSFDCIGLQVGLFYMALLVYISIADDLFYMALLIVLVFK